jgi:hypothetical protein
MSPAKSDPAVGQRRRVAVNIQRRGRKGVQQRAVIGGKLKKKKKTVRACCQRNSWRAHRSMKNDEAEAQTRTT